MDYVNLGNTGLKVSRLCLGCMSYGAPATGKPQPGRHAWTLNEQESQPFLRQALDLGINFFDTANVYSSGDSEVILGRFFKANTRREAVVLATKVHGMMRDEPNGRGLSRKAILHELDESLKRLQTDYVDLYQIHRWDYETPIEETLEALHDVVVAVRQGALHRAPQRLDALRLDAEPLQPDLPGRRAGDDGAVPFGRGSRDSLEPTRTRPTHSALEQRSNEAPGDGCIWQGNVCAHRRSR
jgi:hypothetical protein